jgi:hypothetical protein
MSHEDGIPDRKGHKLLLSFLTPAFMLMTAQLFGQLEAGTPKSAQR